MNGVESSLVIDVFNSNLHPKALKISIDDVPVKNVTVSLSFTQFNLFNPMTATLVSIAIVGEVTLEFISKFINETKSRPNKDSD